MHPPSLLLWASTSPASTSSSAPAAAPSISPSLASAPAVKARSASNAMRPNMSGAASSPSTAFPSLTNTVDEEDIVLGKHVPALIARRLTLYFLSDFISMMSVLIGMTSFCADS